MPDCVRLLASLTLVLFVSAHPVCHANEHQSLLSVMHEVLDGHMAIARSDLSASTPSALSAKLAIELEDMASGNYATTGHRAYTELKPLWVEARERFIASRQPPHGYLPDAVLALPDTVQQIFVADVSSNVAWLLDIADRTVTVADAFYVSIGRAGAGKQRRGDRRTPLGVYFTTGALDTSRLPSRYGSHALPLDYPNALDRQLGRTGDGIWLHGMEPANNVRPPRDTDGCIALANDRIEVLAAALSPWETPVLVVENIRWRPADMRSPLVDVLTERVRVWAEDWKTGDSAAYLAHYAPDFSRDGLAPAHWRKMRREALAARSVAAMDIDAPQILVVDAAAGIYLTRFEHALTTNDGQQMRAIRRLYWQQSEGQWHIIAEQTG
ncbi:MAG: L,D-transpeptidase family protein [Pseudomonadota bacterium]